MYATLSTNKLNMGRSTSCGCNMGVRAREAKTYIDGTCVERLMKDTDERREERYAVQRSV